MPPACQQRSIAVDGYLSAREVHFQCMATVSCRHVLALSAIEAAVRDATSEAAYFPRRTTSPRTTPDNA